MAKGKQTKKKNRAQEKRSDGGTNNLVSVDNLRQTIKKFLLKT